jgi:hypothetical protein
MKVEERQLFVDARKTPLNGLANTRHVGISQSFAGSWSGISKSTENVCRLWISRIGIQRIDRVIMVSIANVLFAVSSRKNS